MSRFLQISDTHLAADGVLVSNRLATDVSLKRLIDRLLDGKSQWGEIDAVLVTGDISDDGSMESYTRYKSLLAPLQLPVYVIPGNHDARETMRLAFQEDGYLPESGPLNWYQRIGEVHVIGLDTLVDGHGYGLLIPETLQFLEEHVKAAKKEPLLIALHHPPFKTGIVFMDAIGLQNIKEFQQVLRFAKGEVRVVCGHIHSMFVSGMGGQVAISCPSPCSNFEADLRKDAPVGFYDREDGCLLHGWHQGFQSVRIAPSAGSGPHPFN